MSLDFSSRLMSIRYQCFFHTLRGQINLIKWVILNRYWCQPDGPHVQRDLQREAETRRWATSTLIKQSFLTATAGLLLFNFCSVFILNRRFWSDHRQSCESWCGEGEPLQTFEVQLFRMWSAAPVGNFLASVQFMITGGSLDDSKEALKLAETRGNSFIAIPVVILPVFTSTNATFASLPPQRRVLLHRRLPPDPLQWVWAEWRVAVLLRAEGASGGAPWQGGCRGRVWTRSVFSLHNLSHVNN